MNAKLRRLRELIELCRLLGYSDYCNKLLDLYWEERYTAQQNRKAMSFTIYANSGRDEKIIHQVPTDMLTIYLDHLKVTGHEIMVLREKEANA